MAKVNITLDTETNTLSVSVNGSAIENVSSAYVYTTKDYDDDETKHCCHISLYEKAEGVEKTTQYYTRSSEQAKDIPQADAKLNIPGFIGVEQKDPTEALAKFFESKSRFK